MAESAAGESKRVAWRLLGALSLAIAIAGSLLSVLPAAAFFVLAAYGFMRGAERLHRWMLDSAVFGGAFGSQGLGGRLSPIGKLALILVLAAAFAGAWAFGLRGRDLIIEGVGLAIVGVYILTRPAAPPSSDSRARLDQRP
ncbi:MAG: hypothetical protein Kilf2KO_39620 [Rhodospirillales bacterium]